MKFFTRKSSQENLNAEKVTENFGWWLPNAMDNAVCTINETYDSIDNDSGFGASETKQNSEPSSLIQSKRPSVCSHCPAIVVEENVHPECIEIAKANSFYRQALTPEGNIKYKNYRILSPTNVGIRVYSPSGDINTSPKKQKIVPKFDLLQSLSPPRFKIMQLINHDDPYSEELRAIIRPYGERLKVPERLKQKEDPGAAACWEFIQQNVCSPSPTNVSPVSSNASYSDTIKSSTPRIYTPDHRRKYLKHRSSTTDQEDMNECNVSPLLRQKSMPCESQMSLSEELSMAENNLSKSVPRKMTDFEYEFFHEDARDSKTPQPYNCMDNKTAAIRSFVQRNMIADSANCDQLARLALTIEEDAEDDNNRDNSFIVAARHMQVRLHDMLKETKQLQENLVDIDKDLQNVMVRAEHAEGEARSLISDVQSLGYLEDVLALLRGEVNLPVLRRKWPFVGYFRRQRDPNVNLIV